MSVLNYTIRVPNFGLILFYLIFIIAIPFIFLIRKYVNGLLYYGLLILGLANIFTQTGHPYIFQNLYREKKENVISWYSTNLLNLIALINIIIILYIKTINQDEEKFPLISLILIIVNTFLLSTKGIKIVMQKADIAVESRKYNLHKFIFGFIALIVIMIFNYFILKASKLIEFTNIY